MNLNKLPQSQSFRDKGTRELPRKGKQEQETEGLSFKIRKGAEPLHESRISLLFLPQPHCPILTGLHPHPPPTKM